MIGTEVERSVEPAPELEHGQDPAAITETEQALSQGLPRAPDYLPPDLFGYGEAAFDAVREAPDGRPRSAPAVVKRERVVGRPEPSRKARLGVALAFLVAFLIATVAGAVSPQASSPPSRPPATPATPATTITTSPLAEAAPSAVGGGTSPCLGYHALPNPLMWCGGR
jgi:hypothetical protein